MDVPVRSEPEADPTPPARQESPGSIPVERPARVVIAEVRPAVDGGRYPAKRVDGDVVVIEARAFTDGHDLVAAAVHHRAPGGQWRTTPLETLPNDVVRGELAIEGLGIHEFVVEAWIDVAATWRSRIERKRAAGLATALDEAELAGLATGTADHVRTSTYRIEVDRPLAEFGAWYEFFPRSTLGDPDVPPTHGTLRDAIDRLPYIAGMGFDVVYLPPIHPIGTSFRKGRNNTLTPEQGDVGSPWAIGAAEGGHDAVHPLLGSVDDVVALCAAAKEHGLEVALDLAFQCSPDHPWVRTHPEWFRRRADGTVAYAENPPKLYQDIVPFDFECDDWRSLWQALAGVVRFWRERGVRIFRVDNPHTKPFAFWEWLIAEMKHEDPGLVFLAEAFTRPMVMQHLAKIGFGQSYTYFAWRQSAAELTEYFTELTSPELVDYYRPNAWPNTPDILTEELAEGGRDAFATRLVLAATLSPSYGIYGPAFELQEHVPVRKGSEEYLDSEKYQLRRWDLDDPGSLRDLITAVNRIRREESAFRAGRSLAFHRCDNDRLMVFSKRARAGSGAADVIVVANTAHGTVQGGWVHLDLGRLTPRDWGAFVVEDLLDGSEYEWHGAHNFVELGPHRVAHIFRLRPEPSSGDSHHDLDLYVKVRDGSEQGGHG